MQSRGLFQINVVSLVAAGLGFACLALPIMTYTVDLSFNNPAFLEEGLGYRTEIYFTDFWVGFRDIRLVVAPAMFLLGTLLACLTPMGGIMMAAGILDFYAEMQGYIGEEIYKHPIVTYDWGPAFYVGILASVVGIASFVYPVRVGFSGAGLFSTVDRKAIVGRILVWNRESPQNQQTVPIPRRAKR